LLHSWLIEVTSRNTLQLCKIYTQSEVIFCNVDNCSTVLFNLNVKGSEICEFAGLSLLLLMRVVFSDV